MLFDANRDGAALGLCSALKTHKACSRALENLILITWLSCRCTAGVQLTR